MRKVLQNETRKYIFDSSLGLIDSNDYSAHVYGNSTEKYHKFLQMITFITLLILYFYRIVLHFFFTWKRREKYLQYLKDFFVSKFQDALQEDSEDQRERHRSIFAVRCGNCSRRMD